MQGTLLAGRYRLRSRLGAGAMGVVWLAQDERLQRPVAVKQLWPGPDDTEESRQRVMREGRIAARLRHPHVITVHDVAEHNGQPALVMEYLPSRSLAAVVAEDGPLEPAKVARIGVQAAAALAAAHAAGVVHRDVKPGNLLVGDDGTVKIADFGISHATGDVTVTRTGVVAGTPAFLSPEVAQGEQPTQDSDVFSLGAALYAAVEGEPPFGEDEGNAIAVLHRVAAGEFPPPQRAGALAPVLTAMLRPDPATRPTAVQLTSALQAVVDEVPVPPDTLSPRDGRTQPVATPSSLTVPVTPVGRRKNATRLTAAPTPDRRRSALRYVLPGAAILVAVAAVAILISIMTASPRGGSISTPSAAGDAAALDAQTLTDTVSGYYALLPAQADAAWTRLGPGPQAQGQSTYRAFWSTVSALTVTAPPQVSGTNTVTVGIAMTLANGSTVTETHELTLMASAPSPLINSDKVLTSDTSTAPPPPPTTTQAPQPPVVNAPPPANPQTSHTKSGPGKHGHG
ncbi:serine/threonine protein kinase [Amycolatopsis sp. K13G38]|uniref:non-specific serine/threonine protein kinase n=2 Tax=Amycolatopsis acididurans TaxID=2724524 RepID=A0ABX1J816_9PSEU|nr:serine/threonine protein kinase [Amycolatopsis acididurans]